MYSVCSIQSVEPLKAFYTSTTGLSRRNTLNKNFLSSSSLHTYLLSMFSLSFDYNNVSNKLLFMLVFNRAWCSRIHL